MNQVARAKSDKQHIYVDNDSVCVVYSNNVFMLVCGDMLY